MHNQLRQRDISRERRKLRIRKKLTGSMEKPRMSVYKSNKHLYVQLIDDVHGNTLASATTLSKNKAGVLSKSKEEARRIGELIASKAKEKGIEKVVFDRGRFKYHGLIAALADGARNVGLKF